MSLKMIKPRVLDTSAIVQDPKSLLSYEDDIYICLTVLEELDNLKERIDRSISSEARVCINLLNQLVGESNRDELEKGIQLPFSEVGQRGRLFIGIDTEMEIHESLKHDLGSKADNRIINYALKLKDKLGENVCLVSRDINMRLKAQVLGLESEDVAVADDIPDIDLLYSGTQAFKGSIFDGLDEKSKLHVDKDFYTLPRSVFNDECQVNMYWYDDNNVGIVVEVNESEVKTKIIKSHGKPVWDVTPKNKRQAICLNQIVSPDFDLNIVLGPAGSGKTYVALAAALELVLTENRYKKIIVVRSRDFMDDDPGFLPGDLKDKSMPLMGGITDALTSLHDDGKDSGAGKEYIIEKANIEFTSMAYFRGRSIDDAVLIIDEAQNLTRGQAKGMLSRGGKNCKTIMLGNLSQIDDRFITAASSGLSAAVNVFRNYEKCSIMIFDEVERSSLARFTEENF